MNILFMVMTFPLDSEWIYKNIFLLRERSLCNFDYLLWIVNNKFEYINVGSVLIWESEMEVLIFEGIKNNERLTITISNGSLTP